MRDAFGFGEYGGFDGTVLGFVFRNCVDTSRFSFAHYDVDAVVDFFNSIGNVGI